MNINKYNITLLGAVLLLAMSIAAKIRERVARDDSTLIAQGVNKIEAATVIACCFFLMAGILNISEFWSSYIRFTDFAVPKYMESPYEALDIDKVNILEEELLNESEEFRDELREVMIYQGDLYKLYTGVIYLVTSIIQGLTIFEKGEIHADGIIRGRRKYKWDEICSYEWTDIAGKKNKRGRLKLSFDVKNGMISRKLLRENFTRLFLYMDKSDFERAEEALKTALAGGENEN